jgi:hypothetical protein
MFNSWSSPVAVAIDTNAKPVVVYRSRGQLWLATP